MRKSTLVLTVAVIATVLVALVATMFAASSAFAMGLGRGHGPMGMLQNLTDEQRQALHEKVSTLWQQGADRAEIRDAVKQYLEEQGIEVPENFGQFMGRGRGPMGGAGVDLSKVNVEVSNTENGVTVTITSDDPDIVTKIQERAAQRCKFMGGGQHGMCGGQQE